jgi:hypothetical protein
MTDNSEFIARIPESEKEAKDHLLMAAAALAAMQTRLFQLPWPTRIEVTWKITLPDGATAESSVSGDIDLDPELGGKSS